MTLNQFYFRLLNYKGMVGDRKSRNATTMVTFYIRFKSI